MATNNHPPRFGLWLLRRIYDEDRVDEIAGDLEEMYLDKQQTRGNFIATVCYLRDVLLSVRNMDLNRKARPRRQNNSAMLAYAILISYRSLKKRASYSLLNIAGLASSIAFAFLLWFYVQDQYAYDRHYTLANRIYRVNIDCDMNGKRDIYCNVPQPVAGALKTNYPEVTETLRVAVTDHTGILEFNAKQIRSEKLLIAESTFFDFYGREFIGGSATYALAEPNSIVIQESLALALFGSTDALGKVIRYVGEEKPLQVTGVIRDDARPTHLPMEAVISWATFRDREVDWWYGAHAYTYLLLNPRNDIAELDNKMPAFFTRYMKKTFDEFNGQGKLFFQPVTAIHLSEEYVWEPYPHGSAINVIALTCVALFLIGFAAINYINLATARSVERAPEVGIRKVLGSSTRFLWVQFLSESLLLSLSATALAMVLCWSLLPYFNSLSGMAIDARQLFAPSGLLLVTLVAIGIGLFAGLFPASYLSSLNALKVSKGGSAGSGRGELLRKFLVTSQYFVAALLISGIVLVYQQIAFIKNKDIGFKKENLVSIRLPEDSVVSRHIPVFIDALKASDQIISVTRARLDLHKETDSFTPTLENEDGSKFQMGADLIYVDADFIETIGAELTTGRNFTIGPNEQEHSVLINEAAVKKFGWGKNPLAGKFAAYTPREPAPKNVVGVVKDFHLGVSYQQVHPTLIFLSDGSGSNLYVRIKGEHARETIDQLRMTWRKSFPNSPFEFNFVDQLLDSLYNREQKFVSLLSTFCYIIVFIASLGIIGLISYTIQRKKKEIAIRKVIGSSSGNIIALLSGKFIHLLIVANLIAMPVTYFVFDLWLTNFAERIEFSVWPFLAGFFACLFFTAFSLLYHTVRAASANPVDALKYE